MSLTPANLLKRQTAAMEKIIAAITKHYDITQSRLTAPGREEPRNTQRQVAIYLVRTITGMSLQNIAGAFGKKDHNTIRHAVAVVPEKFRTDKELRALVEKITKQITL